MSITIAADMHLLCNLFNISYQKIANDYQGMSVDEIMQAEAAQGNTAAANFDSTVLSDPSKLIELFKLTDTGNKYAILNNMSGHDLDELLPLLQQDDLVQGLNFFTKDKLLSMTESLPKDQMLKLVGQMFSQDQVMQYLPEDQLNNMLQSTDMDKQQEIKYLQTVKPEVLALMLQNTTGQPIDGTQNTELEAQTGQSTTGNQNSLVTSTTGLAGQPHYDGAAIINQIANLPDNKFQEAMLSMPKQNKRDFLLLLANENPKLNSAVDSHAYADMINQRKDKNDIVKAAYVLDQNQLVKMDSKLPKDLTAVVLTQLDTNKFADKLMAGFKNILREIIAG